MKYLNKIENDIIGECESCGRKLEESLDRLEKVGDNFKCIDTISCICGRDHENILRSTYTVRNNTQITNNNFIQCPSCNKGISNQAVTCIHCGHPIKAQKKMSFWTVVFAIVIAFVIIGFLL